MLSLEEALTLSYLPGVGNKTLKILLRKLSEEDFHLITNSTTQLILNELKKDKREKALASFQSGLKAERDKAQKTLTFCADNQITILYFFQENFPAQLKTQHDSPVFLYCKGNLSLLNSTSIVAVIGSRECSVVGKEIAKRTTRRLIESDFVILSGLAKGIDYAAHSEALLQHGKTIAILVDVYKIYPSNHKELSEKILQENGLLIAQNPPQTTVNKGFFVERDKLQAMLSVSVFLIESKLDGGSMHCAEYALRAKKPVYVPEYPRYKYLKEEEVLMEGGEALCEKGASFYSSSSYDEIIEAINRQSGNISSAGQLF